MLRPKWIGVLLLALVVAGIFASLGRWQVEQAILSSQRSAESAPPGEIVPLGAAEKPGRGTPDASIGAPVSFTGSLDARDFDVVHGRLQGEALGFWVIGHARVDADGATTYPEAPADAGEPGAAPAPAAGANAADARPSLAVVLGWAPDEATADAAAASLRAAGPGAGARAAAAPDAVDAELTASVLRTGVLEYGQAPEIPRGGLDAHALTTMAPAYLVNRWVEPGPAVYSGYVILDDTAGALPALGLEQVRQDVVVADSSLNWLNIFYAIEWVVFAGFAIFMWWRLVRDEWMRERAAPAEAALAREREARRELLRELMARRGGTAE